LFPLQDLIVERMMTILSHKHSRTLAIYRHQDHFFFVRMHVPARDELFMIDIDL